MSTTHFIFFNIDLYFSWS